MSEVKDVLRIAEADVENEFWLAPTERRVTIQPSNPVREPVMLFEGAEPLQGADRSF